MPRTARLLLVLSALILLGGSALHAAAFKKAQAVLAAVKLPPFDASAFKALWLIDSTTLISLAVIFAVIAVRPVLASRPLIVLLTLPIIATAIVMYVFMGFAFPPSHILLGAAVLAIAGGALMPGNSAAS